MLDAEGGEERALRGAEGLLRRPAPSVPNLVFEVHRHYVDWSHGLEKTGIVAMLLSFGYMIYAIRDYHANIAIHGRAIEVIPVDRVYFGGHLTVSIFSLQRMPI